MLKRFVVTALGLALFQTAGCSPPTTQAPPVPQEPPSMQVDLPPITEPSLMPVSEAVIDDRSIVIGIVVNGVPRAYLREALSTNPEHHIVIDTIESTNFAITHCDHQRCTRVLARAASDEPLDVRVGGWGKDQTMELIVNGKRYSQKSAAIPLDEIPFVEMPWKEWRERHPETLVYMGPEF